MRSVFKHPIFRVLASLELVLRLKSYADIKWGAVPENRKLSPSEKNVRLMRFEPVGLAYRPWISLRICLNDGIKAICGYVF